MRYAKNREVGEAKASNDAQGNDNTGREGAGGSDDAGTPEGDSGSWRKKEVGKEKFVYFIKANKFVKIGCSADVASRLDQLRMHVPDAVLLGYIPGSYAREREIHELLAEHKSHGEWFKDCKSLRQFLNELPLITIAEHDLVSFHIKIPYSVWLSIKTEAAKAGMPMRQLATARLEAFIKNNPI